MLEIDSRVQGLAAKILPLLSVFLLLTPVIQAQKLRNIEQGFISGISRLGVESPLAQPLYGIGLSLGWNRNIHAEAAFYYSQRMRGKMVQSDYLSLAMLFKPGFRGEKAGLFYVGGLVLSPALYHRNTQNHTYISTVQGLGAECYLYRRLTIDLKMCYDLGLTGGLYENDAYRIYSGPMLMLGVRMNLACRPTDQ